MERETEAQRAMRERRERWDRLAGTINEIARFKRMTATSLAVQLGMSRQKMSYKLTGKVRITEWEADGFAVALGVPRDLLEKRPHEALLQLLEEEMAATGSSCSLPGTCSAA